MSRGGGKNGEQSITYFNNAGNNGGAEKWSDSEHILKAEPTTEFANMK